jgi:hypothetical protein
MSGSVTLDEIESAALSALAGLTRTKIAYVARRQDDVWTITADLGLKRERSHARGTGV